MIGHDVEKRRILAEAAGRQPCILGTTCYSDSEDGLEEHWSCSVNTG